MIKKISIYFTLILLMACQCHAFDLDETVDDEIRKTYNSSKLIEDVGIKSNATSKDERLPNLPSILKQNENANYKSSSTVQVPRHQYVSGSHKIRRGTVIEVVSTNQVSDWQKAGTNVRFVTKKIKNGKGYTLPITTAFNGEIIESHQPQISCNGGLVVIKVHSMNYKGQAIPINAYVIRANDKKIFFNNIKGKRTYLATMYKKGNWGRTLFGKMLNLTVNLGGDGSTVLFSPFPFLYGTICLGANTLVSPITAFFSKGGHVSIPSGSYYKIKLIDDVWID